LVEREEASREYIDKNSKYLTKERKHSIS